ncbi:MAG: hemolysin family protein [Desulfobulbaceae bacterium]|nr:hemolysin family protein [Desulfobulbaceae bacterium]
MYQLIMAVGLAITVSALCSVFEAVLYSIPMSHIEVLSRSGKLSGRVLKKLKKDIHQPIIAILTLNTIANTMGASVAGASAAMVFGKEHLGLFSLVFTAAILLFSEIMPKTAGVVYYGTLAPWIALPMQGLVKLMTPITWFIQALTRLLFGDRSEALVSAEEIEALAGMSRKTGAIDPQQEKVIRNILSLKNKVIRNAMTPRTVTFTLHEHLTVDEAIKSKEDWHLHSRVPVYDKDPDDIVGIVLRKDVLLSSAEGKGQRPLSALMHPVHFVPEAAPLNNTLIEFFDRRRHLFVVVDEYGSFTGVISLEDILEEIMGREIMDESDPTKSMRELARLKKKARTEESVAGGNGKNGQGG